MSNNIPKVAMVTIASDWLNYKEAFLNSIEATKYLNKKGIKVFNYEKIIHKNDDIDSVSKDINGKGFDIVIINVGTYMHDNTVLKFVKSINSFPFIWTKDSGKHFDDRRTSALAGFLLNAGMLSKCNIKFEFLFGKFEEKDNFKKLSSTYKAIGLINKIKKMKIGILGRKAPGMLDISCNDLLLANKFNCDFFYFSEPDVFLECKKVKNEEIEEEKDKISKKGKFLIEDNSIINESIKLYLAVRNICYDNNIDAVSFQCWPNFKPLNLPTPCLSLSLLSEDNIPCSCEGDLLGLFSMIILEYFTGEGSFLCDFLSADLENNVAGFYHCGATSMKLKCNGCEVLFKNYDRHPGFSIGGITTNFVLKSGSVILLRLSEKDGRLRAIHTTGEAIESERFVDGNCIKVRFENSLKELIYSLIRNSCEHHHTISYGSCKNELALLCKYLGLDLIRL